MKGNAGTTPTTNFVGTTDNNDLAFRTDNTENMRIQATSGALGIGTKTPGAYADPSVRLDIVDTTNGANSDIEQLVVGNTSHGGGPYHTFALVNGTLSAPTPVGQNAPIGTLYYAVYNGSAYTAAADLIVNTDGVLSTTSTPGRFDFYTTPIGSTTPVEVMTIKNNGYVGIGTTTPVTHTQVGSFSDAHSNFITVGVGGGNQYQSGINLMAFDSTYGFSLIDDDPSNGFIIRHRFASTTGIDDI